MRSVCLLLLYLSSCTNSAKILGVFNLATYSHFSPGQTLMNALVDKGHDVSVIASYDDEASKFKTIHLSGFKEKMQEMLDNMNMFQKTSTLSKYYNAVITSPMRGIHLARSTLEHPNVQRLLKSNETFDAIIFEQFDNEAFHGFCDHFNATCIVFSSLQSNYWLNPIMRNPENPAHMAQMFHKTEIPMNFHARVLNSLMLGVQSAIFHGMVLPNQDTTMRQYFPNSPRLKELLHKTDLILLNSHVSYSQVGPLVPGMVEIGGFHLKEAGRLSEDLQKFLDASKQGVILFSMGSVIHTADIPLENREILVNVFKKLKMNVLWKFDEDLSGLPDNVKTIKWIPQREVLAHPNVKLFITHGGLSSIIESVYYAVPIIGMPIFGDQNFNIQVMKSKGCCVELDFWNLNEDDLLNAILEVITNNKYGKQAKLLSNLIKDRPMKPIDTATYWIEHVIKHKGGKHLKTLAVDLHWYQYMLIDVVAFLAIVGCGSFWIMLFVLRKLSRKYVTSQISKKKKNK